MRFHLKERNWFMDQAMPMEFSGGGGGAQGCRPIAVGIMDGCNRCEDLLEKAAGSDEIVVLRGLISSHQYRHALPDVDVHGVIHILQVWDPSISTSSWSVLGF